MQMRLQKYLSQSGLCSRRKAEEYIIQGLVKINGKVATIGQSVDADIDKITVDDKVQEIQSEFVYYKFNKPYGVVTTCKQGDETSILDIVQVPERVFPIGRLDKNSTGLLLLTNDGRLSNYLMHPSFDHEKEYVVEIYGKITDESLEKMSKGVYVLGKKTRPAEINRISTGTFSIILKEGRNRQIRRMVESVGGQVKKLVRVRIENIFLGTLPAGSFARLTERELNNLFARLKILR